MEGDTWKETLGAPFLIIAHVAEAVVIVVVVVGVALWGYYILESANYTGGMNCYFKRGTQ